MADRTVESEENEVPEIDETLEKVLIYCLEEAKEKSLQGEEVVPFTAMVLGDKLLLENHPGDSVEDCFLAARQTVEGARGAAAYAFCYDGYVDTDAGTKDAIIAEGGLPGVEEGVAVGYLYDEVDGKYVFNGDPAYIGPSPNYMEKLKPEDVEPVVLSDSEEASDDAE